MIRFELGAWGDDGPVPLSRWQGCADELAAAGAGLFLDIDGQERIGSAWSLGDLARLAQQLEPAAARLEAGKLAVVRSAEDDGESVPYLRFRPRDGVVEVTLFFIAPSEGDIAALYSIPWSGDPARLYRWVEEAGDRLLDTLPEDLRTMAWGPFAVPRDELIAQMRATVKRARELGLDVPATEPPLRST